jgi:hypothetical protein
MFMRHLKTWIRLGLKKGPVTPPLDVRALPLGMGVDPPSGGRCIVLDRPCEFGMDFDPMTFLNNPLIQVKPTGMRDYWCVENTPIHSSKE